MRTLILTAVLLAGLCTDGAAATCAGADPAIVSVKVQNVAGNGSVNHYTLVGRVTNLGNRKQASNVLQFVDIYQNGTRLEDRGVPPLAPGQSYTFSYDWQRAMDAGSGTTTLHFSLRMTSPSPPGNEDCNPGNNTSSVTF
ncbi:MAG TPA: CARDB domain-containing protein [Candidatus Cybelea sp.]|nr:CARDB domain-containing protein [Candidatus Cybelea sp.]